MKKIVFIFITLLLLVTSCGKKQGENNNNNSTVEEKYEVRFTGVNDELISTISVKKDEKIVYPTAPVVEGYEFVVWEMEIEYTNKDIIIKALYNRFEYTVKFYNNDGIVIDAQTVYHGDSATTPNVDMSIESGAFIGWDTDFSKVTSNLEVKPIYQKHTFIVNFYDALGSIISTQKVEYGESAEKPDNPEKEGAEFLGWSESFNNVTSNLEVYPMFEDRCYEVSFYDMYGNLLYSECVKYGYSGNAPEVPVVPYHTFAGWDVDYSNIRSNTIVRAKYTKDDSNYSINDVNYWLSIMASKYDINKVLLTNEEINSYNNSIVSVYNKTKVVDLRSVYKKELGTDISDKINAYVKMNSYTIYNDSTNKALSTDEEKAILANRNLDNIPSIVINEFGIVTSFAWLRAYPTNHYAKDYSMDRFQETSLNVGEGVVISHTSSDGLWYFVQAENYNGWIEAKYVAKCAYEEMIEFLYPTNNLVVISDYVKFDNEHVRMGQSFPLVENNDNSYVIFYPTRTTEGNLFLKSLTLGKTDDYHVGYLEYTYKNVFKQAFKLLGIDYSWGDKSTSGRDCSSTMNGIYKSFGFMMPRNTSNQLAIPGYGQTVSGLTVSSLMKYNPGTLIFTSSHVMMYIGENLNGAPYLLHNTTSNGGGCILQSFESYGGSRMIAILNMQ